jgi:predicted transcriptional regulator
MTDGQPPDALQSKLLGIVQEFKGLNGISAARLAREAKKEPDLVERILKGLEVGGMVRPRKADNLTLWMITVKGEQVLDGHIAEMEVDQVNAIEILVPEQGSIVEVEEDTDVLVDMPTAAPDDPSMWFVCDYVDADGIKCDKRFTTAQGLKHHKTSKHGKQSKKGGRFPCTEKDCNKVFDSAQGLLMHRQRVHLKTLISPGRPTVGSDASINDRIKQLYPDHTVRESTDSSRRASCSANRGGIPHRVSRRIAFVTPITMMTSSVFASRG